MSVRDSIATTVLKENPEAQVWLYGSRARGDNREDSDWDVLILLNQDKITPTDRSRIENSLFDLGFNTNQLISPILYTVKEWEWRHDTPFYDNVMHDRQILI